MAIGAIVQDGQILETASQNSVSAQKSSGTETPKGYDKDAFLQLLVAQMKYQDPLEPTSNTEYISQYATFSQVEQLQNMAGAMDLSRASAMVGKTVQITTEDKEGNPKVVEGTVEFVKYENNKAFVSINGELYSTDAVTAIIDDTYNAAYNLAEQFAKAVNELPALANLSLADEGTINDLVSGYNALNAYQQSFIDESYVTLLKKYSERMAELVESRDQASKAQAEEEKAREEAENTDTTVEEVTEA